MAFIFYRLITYTYHHFLNSGNSAARHTKMRQNSPVKPQRPVRFGSPTWGDLTNQVPRIAPQ